MNSLTQGLAEHGALLAAGKTEEAAILAETLIWPLYKEGRSDEAIQLLRATFTSATNSITLAQAWLRLGEMLYAKDIYPEAREAFCIGLTHAGDDRPVTAKLTYGIGNTYFLEGRNADAQGFYENSLELCREAELDKGTCDNQVQLSVVATAQGQIALAETLAKASLVGSVQQQYNTGVRRSLEALLGLIRQFAANNRFSEATQLAAFAEEHVGIYQDSTAVALLSEIKKAVGG